MPCPSEKKKSLPHAVADAVAKAEEKLSAAMTKAKKDKEDAVKKEVKKALEEAAKAKKKEADTKKEES